MLPRVSEAARRLFRNPAYAIPAVLTLGVGIGSVAAVHALARGAMWRPVPGVAAPDGLITVQLESTENSVTTYPFSHPDLRAISGRIPSAGKHAAYLSRDVHFATGTGEAPARVHGQAVTAGYFSTLGVRMAAGRAFLDAPGAGAEDARSAVVSHDLWVRYWDGFPEAVGAVVLLNGEPFTVVGVAPEGFRGTELPGRARIWVRAEGLPALLHDPDVLTRRGEGIWQVVVVRPRGGTSSARVEAEFNSAVASIRAAGGSHSFVAVHLLFRAYEGIGVPPQERARVARILMILFAAAGLLLLLTCANVANLGLVRSLSVRKETALRSAMGASHARLVWERVGEHALVGLAGGFVALGLAAAVPTLLPDLGATDLELDVARLGVDPAIGVVTFAVALLAGLLSSLVPALELRRRRAASLLGSRGSPDRGSRRLGGLLVASQVGLSTVLVVGAVLFVETVRNLGRVELGFAPEGIVAFSLDPGLQGYDEERTSALREALLTELRRSPRIEEAALVHFPPFSPRWFPAVWRRPDGGDDDPFVARTFAVTPSFFDVLDLAVRGEVFGGGAPTDGEDEPETAMVNEAAAEALFPGLPVASVVGKTVVPRGGERPPIHIVGVVEDARLGGVRRPAEPQVFRPWSQSPREGRFTAYVATPVPADRLVPELREIVSRLDPALPLYAIRSLESELAGLTAGERFLAGAAVALGAVAVFLAALGLYSLLAYLVGERWREIGIRSALGALPRQVVQLVLGLGVRLTLLGCGIGVLGALALERFIESRLFGVAALDPRLLGAVAALLLVVTVLASWIPARRALRLDIVEVLRSE